jgi:hypothetical protein
MPFRLASTGTGSRPWPFPGTGIRRRTHPPSHVDSFAVCWLPSRFSAICNVQSTILPSRCHPDGEPGTRSQKARRDGKCRYTPLCVWYCHPCYPVSLSLWKGWWSPAATEVSTTSTDRNPPLYRALPPGSRHRIQPQEEPQESFPSQSRES